MATITENLQAIRTAKQNIKQAIEGKGQNLTNVPFTQYAEKIGSIQTGITPSGNIDIEDNGTYNVSQYENAVVNVEKGVFPTGTIEITENKTYDVSNYASANVNVASAGGEKDMLQAMVDNTNSCEFLFSNYKGTTLDISRLDTSRVTSMTRMFGNCENLTELDVKNLNTGNVTTMSYMFIDCYKLESLDLSNFNTSNLVNADGIFNYCSKLKSLDLSNFDVSKVNTMNNLIGNCRALETLNISGWDTSKVTSYGGFAYNCMKLISIIGTLDFYSCTSFVSNMFDSCNALTNLNLKNIRANLRISYSPLTVDSLVNTIKELWDYSSDTKSYTLTLSSTSKAKLSNVYVKLITPTTEQIEADPYINSKMPCEVCASTDEGAMLITDYANLKNWTLA